MYLSLKDGNFLLIQPQNICFSYILNNKRLTIGVNKSAADIIKLLNGQFTKEMIINNLCIRYNESYSTVWNFVSEFLENLNENNLLHFSETHLSTVVAKGTGKYYIPEHVTVELTHKCPLNCEHCFINAGRGQELRNEDSIFLFEKLLDIGVREFQLTGGEPFVYRNINKIIHSLIQNNSSVHLTTSGYLWSKSIRECLDEISNGIDPLIQVSLDGLKETHNKIRGNSNSFQHAIKFIKECINRSIPTIVATSLLNQSPKEIEELTKLLKQIGVSEHRLGLVTEQGRAKENNVERFTFSEYNNLLQNLTNKYNGNKFIVEELETTVKSISGCGAGYKTLKITPSLMVTPCAMMQVNIGNLKKESVEKVLERSYSTFSRINYPNPSICSSCAEKEYCNGCLSEALLRMNNVEICSWKDSQEERVSEITSGGIL